jgi:hypothetical protein
VLVNILALIAAFSTSIGFYLTVFYTGWHCPILHVFTDMRFNELLEFLSSLKQLQWLPSRCSNAAVYLLLGAEPIQATINKRMLSLFGQINRDQNSMENKIAYRQIAIYDLNSKEFPNCK